MAKTRKIKSLWGHGVKAGFADLAIAGEKRESKKRKGKFSAKGLRLNKVSAKYLF